jgi:hypothetical protein
VIGVFRERSALQVPALLVLALLLKMGYTAYQLPAAGYPQPGGLLVQWINQHLVGHYSQPFLNVLCLLLLLGSAFYANVVANNRRLFQHRSLLVALCVLLFSSLFPGTNVQLPALLVLPLLIACFAVLTRLYQTDKARSHIVNAGILAGLAYLLYHPALLLIPACFVGLAHMRPFRLAEWLLLLVGLLTPAYFVLAIEFLTNHWQPARHLPRWQGTALAAPDTLYWWVAAGMGVLWLLLGFASWNQQTRRMVIQIRKNWYALLFIGLLLVPAMLLWPGHLYGVLALLSFPVGCLLASTFAGEGKGIGQLVFFWLLIIATAVVGWGWKSGAM